MAEEKPLPEDVYFLEHVGMTRKQLGETPNGKCKTCGKKSEYDENALCVLCPFSTFYCHKDQVDVEKFIDENFMLYGLCKVHRDTFNTLVARVKSTHGAFPARECDYPTCRKQRLADLAWKEELRHSILRFRIAKYGHWASSETPEKKRKVMIK